ncbi:hypothetical protein BX257_8284 [Streptomyces sp. 3212.3]|nr:hypothetical protein BX257_8284 [Streptomyces sp. 3212.3]
MSRKDGVAAGRALADAFTASLLSVCRGAPPYPLQTHGSWSAACVQRASRSTDGRRTPSCEETRGLRDQGPAIPEATAPTTFSYLPAGRTAPDRAASPRALSRSTRLSLGGIATNSRLSAPPKRRNNAGGRRVLATAELPTAATCSHAAAVRPPIRRGAAPARGHRKCTTRLPPPPEPTLAAAVPCSPSANGLKTRKSSTGSWQAAGFRGGGRPGSQACSRGPHTRSKRDMLYMPPIHLRFNNMSDASLLPSGKSRPARTRVDESGGPQ